MIGLFGSGRITHGSLKHCPETLMMLTFSVPVTTLEDPNFAVEQASVFRTGFFTNYQIIRTTFENNILVMLSDDNHQLVIDREHAKVFGFLFENDPGSFFREDSVTFFPSNEGYIFSSSNRNFVITTTPKYYSLEFLEENRDIPNDRDSRRGVLERANFDDLLRLFAAPVRCAPTPPENNATAKCILWLLVIVLLLFLLMWGLGYFDERRS